MIPSRSQGLEIASVVGWPRLAYVGSERKPSQDSVFLNPVGQAASATG